MTSNDYLVIVADILNKAALAALGANAVGITLPGYIALALLVLASATGTLLTHLQPVGSKRSDS